MIVPPRRNSWHLLGHPYSICKERNVFHVLPLNKTLRLRRTCFQMFHGERFVSDAEEVPPLTLHVPLEASCNSFLRATIPYHGNFSKIKIV